MLWVADITYISTWAGFLYLAVVLDVFSRRIVGWSMATTLHTQVVLDALSMALWQRRAKDVIHHSDQGSQYTSIEFGKRCREAGVRPRWDRSVMPTTMRWRRVSSPRSNASCWTGDGSGRKPRRAWQSSSSSRVSIIHAAATLRSATCRPSSSSASRKKGLSIPAHHPAAVLGAVNVRPGDVAMGGEVSATADLDRPCARRLHVLAGRDEKMLSAEPKDGLRKQQKEDTLPPNPLP